MKPDLLCRSGSKAGRRTYRPVVGAPEVKAANRLCDNEDRLRLREARSYAGMRPDTKGNVGAFLNRGLALAEKALRNKGTGPVPVTLMAMQGPGRNHHQCPTPQPALANVAIFKGDPWDKRNGWIKPKRFPEYGAHQGQFFHVTEMDGVITHHVQDFSAKPAHQIGLHGKEVEDPCEGTGRRLMASQEEDAQLVDQFISRKGRTRICVTSGNHVTGDIIKGLGLLKMGIDQITEMAPNSLTGCRDTRGWGTSAQAF